MIGKLFLYGFFTVISGLTTMMVWVLEEGIDGLSVEASMACFAVMMILSAIAFIKNLKFYLSPEYEMYKIEKRSQRLDNMAVIKKAVSPKARRKAMIGVGSIAYLTFGTIAKLTKKYM